MTRHEETRDVTWLVPRVLLGTGGLVRGAVTLVSDPPADHHVVWWIVSCISWWRIVSAGGQLVSWPTFALQLMVILVVWPGLGPGHQAVAADDVLQLPGQTCGRCVTSRSSDFQV